MVSGASVLGVLFLKPLDQWQCIMVGNAVQEATQIMLAGKQRQEGQGLQWYTFVHMGASLWGYATLQQPKLKTKPLKYQVGGLGLSISNITLYTLRVRKMENHAFFTANVFSIYCTVVFVLMSSAYYILSSLGIRANEASLTLPLSSWFVVTVSGGEILVSGLDYCSGWLKGRKKHITPTLFQLLVCGKHLSLDKASEGQP